jgi:hypothetical protein
MAVLEELEDTARLWLQARPTPLDEAQRRTAQRVRRNVVADRETSATRNVAKPLD